jgi:ribosomal RNA-processing protein 1
MAAPFARQLADSTDKRVRARAVAALRNFLSTAPAEEDEVQNLEWDAAEPQDARFSRLEMEKLQKALFYAFFHCDKPIPQQTLADTLSKLMLDINAGSDAATFKAACSYYRAFWTILVKEWSNIDRLRMDKYLMLIRKYVTAAFKLLARVEWRAEAVKEHNLILQEIPLQ